MSSTTLASVAEIQVMLEQYNVEVLKSHELQQRNSNASDSTKSLHRFLATTAASGLYDRKNFAGHLTASAFILDPSGEHVLLLHHKTLNRWLQPGGHIDKSDESILTAAFREVREETGILKASLMLIPISTSAGVPFDINSHPIPANPKKNEPAHVHHDFRYLLQVKDSAAVEICADESTGFQWVTIEKLRTMEDHARVAEKIGQIRRRVNIA